MSFLFKSKQKSATPNALPAATRDIKSSDGPAPTSQAQTLNGVVNGMPKSASPTLGGSISGNSIGQEPAVRPVTRPSADEKAPYVMQEGARNSGPPSPEQKTLRERSMDAMRQRPPGQAPAPAPVPASASPLGIVSRGVTTPDPSPYPWSWRPLTFTVTHTNPFPRYGAAVNASASKDGSIYLMGGLINGSTVKGDLWMVEAGSSNMTCYPVATTSEGPGPRVGHASLLVGNAFIVFGGDTKMDEGDMLDDTLYLLNTSTKQWSRALPAGPRPPGRYGHTLNILGSKIYIFGGQVEGYFFNDLVAFDLNALQQATNKWELLIQNSLDGGPKHGQIPPARTNHTIVSWADKLYLFGGTDGVVWFNDVWSYSPQTNSWTELECIGYIPSPREGHAAALVGDVMYIFGGRTEDGNDLGDLAAFRITSRRWYTFQNMGPSPSPRSGHSMTTIGKQIVVLAGEPSSAPRDLIELAHAYFLDTTKIRYPTDTAASMPINERIQGNRAPNAEKNGFPGGVPAGRGQPLPRDLMERERMGSGDSSRMRPEPHASRMPEATRSVAQPTIVPAGPPPGAPPQQPRPNGVPTSRQPTRALSPSVEADRLQSLERSGKTSPQPQPTRGSPGLQELAAPGPTSFGPETSFYDSGQSSDQPRRQKPETYQPSQDQSAEALSRSLSNRQKAASERKEKTPRQSIDAPEQLPKVQELQREGEPLQGSGIRSSPVPTQQYDNLHKELDQAKRQNAWYASELALARKSGYQTRSAESPVLDERAQDTFGDDDKPLVEALLKMRSELARVQDTIDEESKHAAERIAEMEKQRDAAISEAVYAKTRLASQGSPQPDSEGKRSPDPDRNNDMSRRLASSLGAQSVLSRRIDSIIQEAEAEKRSRQLAEDTADTAQKRVMELESNRQQHTSDLETLRTDLHEAQRAARDASASHAEIKSQHAMLTIDKNELSGKLESALAQTRNHASILTSLRDAVTASSDKASMLEQKLQEERSSRNDVEQRLQQLKGEHEARSTELESTSKRLRDAEELAEKHAEEARTHRGAVLAGLGTINDRDMGSTAVTDERVVALQQQVDSANALVRQNQAAADAASEKLRRAEERIAGLEAFQEQASREGLSIRKQLQTAMKDNQVVSTQKLELEQRVQSQMLEANALAVQHASLKDILGERGINVSELRKSRAVDSPSSLSHTRFSTPDLRRVQELEQQLDASLKSHDDMKTQLEEVSERDDKMKREYEEKLTALDNDHQAAVKYLRGTEKMLSKMKQELQRVKNENGEVKKKLEKAKEDNKGPSEAPAEWESEREKLKKEVADVQANLHSSISDLEGKLATMQQRLQATESEAQQARNLHATSQADLVALQSSHSQSKSDIDRLRKDNTLLEERARDAESKVQLLLDQVESSVDSYRRQSRLNEATSTANGNFHRMELGGGSDALANHGGNTSHTRNISDGGSSTFSTSESIANGDGRNSLALDSLANELETLRSHWETTNKSYRLSDKFDFERTPTSAHQANASGDFGGLAGWRRGLDLGDDDESDKQTNSGGDDADTVKGEVSRQGSVHQISPPDALRPGGVI